jgi:hypothetical protein
LPHLGMIQYTMTTWWLVIALCMCHFWKQPNIANQTKPYWTYRLWPIWHCMDCPPASILEPHIFCCHGLFKIRKTKNSIQMICWSLVGQPLGVPTFGLPHCRFSASTSSGKSVDNSAKGCQKRRLEHFVAAIQANSCLCSSLQGNKLINIANPMKDCVWSNCRSVSPRKVEIANWAVGPLPIIPSGDLRIYGSCPLLLSVCQAFPCHHSIGC